MSTNISIAIAFSAGVLSFLSPCVLPLIPSYLSLIGGVSVQDLGERKRSKVFLRTVLFVLGFSIVFIALGVLFSGTGGFFSGATQIINIVAGVLVIVLGLNFIFNFWKFLNFEKRLHMRSSPTGRLGALLLGMAFGGGWTPCVGPILASILFLAGSSAQVLQGTLLLAVYSLGLGLPFILAGLFFSQFLGARERMKRHFDTLRIVSGAFLVLIGLLIALGRLQRFNIFLFRLAGWLDNWNTTSPWQVRLTFTALFLIPAVLLGISYLKRARAAGGFPLFPGRGVFLLIFLALAVATISGTLNPTIFFTFWFTYQGI
ncbi:MAG: cytochrome c biogenesis protein CcdA [Spirochaetaceae bacterium]|nr:MAG: cytochrome c biogenesis protein CcdA [Spirochaetaceae bacterium]